MTLYFLCADGACSGNPGPGGYAWELWEQAIAEGCEVVSGAGSSPETTNNIMELRAAIDGLVAVAEGLEQGRIDATHLVLEFDSQYVLNGITDGLDEWKMRGWRTANNKPVKNRELWEEIDAVLKRITAAGLDRDRISAKWVKGHAGHIGNERVDTKAAEMRDLAKAERHGPRENAPVATTPDAPIEAAGPAHGADAEISDAVTPDQVALMRSILSGYEAGDISIKDLVREIRANRDALG